MTLGPLDLLRLLGSGLRPDAASSEAPQQGLEAQGFGELLERVRSGAVSSQRPIEIDPASGVTLDDEQSKRLGVAIDAAEAAGHAHVVALIDGQALRVDVSERRVTSALDPSSARLEAGIDAVISIPRGSLSEIARLFSGRSDSRADQSSLLAGLGGPRNTSLATLLQEFETRSNDDTNGPDAARAA